MGVFAVSITKSVNWRNKAEEFSNIYHYGLSGVSGSNADTNDWTDLINGIVAAEKAVHGTNVSFLRARVWGPTEGSKAASLMRHERALSGTGSVSAGSVPYQELTVVVAWPLGRNPATGRKRYLRKFLHVGRSAHTGDLSTGTMAATGPAFYRDNYAVPVRFIEEVNPGEICAPNGDTPIGPAYVLDTFRIRQFTG